MPSIPEENRSIVRRIYRECFSRDDWGAAEEHMAADYVNHNLAPGAAPGRDGLRLAIASLRRVFPDLRYEIEDIVAERDAVAVRSTMLGTHTAEFLGVPASGRTVEVPALAFIRLDAGRVVERWGLQDDGALLRQLRGQ